MPGDHANDGGLRTLVARRRHPGLLITLLIRPLFLGILAGISVIPVGVATLVFQIGLPLPRRGSSRRQVCGTLVALIGSLVYAVFNTVLSAVFSVRRRRFVLGDARAAARGPPAGRDPHDKPGLVIVQIDGLAHPILAHQVSAGRVPTWPAGSARRR